MSAVSEAEWLDDQVQRFRERRTTYVEYAEWLEETLDSAARRLAPLAIVQTRTKEIASFAEKCLRKGHLAADPVQDFTDFCGARVIVPTQDDLRPIESWLRGAFEIDWANSDDTAERLEPTQFGYLSIHYIVSPGSNAPPAFRGLKAEVQLRTLLQHAWSEATHDVLYKGGFDVPAPWLREAARIAAELEDVDDAFTRIHRALALYETSYGRRLERDELERELTILETVLKHDPDNERIAWRAGKMAMALGDWPHAVRLMTPHVDTLTPGTSWQPLVRDLGVALCKRHEATRSVEFRDGQRLLEVAAAEPHHDPDALSALAGTYKGVDDDRARELYRAAFELDPADYYTLGNYLESELQRFPDARILDPLGPTIDAASERCRAHASVEVNLPWALLSLGQLQLLRRRPYNALTAYAEAKLAATASWMLDAARESLDRLASAGVVLEGLDWCRWLLALAAGGDALRDYPLAGAPLPDVPVLIVAGAAGESADGAIARARQLLGPLLAAFDGVVVSGGTDCGVPGLVGELAPPTKGPVSPIGYLPESLPQGTRADGRYAELRRTGGATFSPAEPLQYWTDILRSGIAPERVSFAIYDGGPITAVEQAIARSLGASEVQQ